MADSIELLRLRAKAKIKAEAERTPESDLPTPEMGTGEAILHGVGQGLFGLGDEGAGAVHNPLGALKQIGTKFGLADENGPDVQDYRKTRDMVRQRAEEAASQRPEAYYPAMIGSGALGAVAGGIPGMIASGAMSGVGSSNGESLGDDLRGGVTGGAVGGLAGAGAKTLGSVAPDVFNAISSKLGRGAEKLAENATGATRVQAEKFAPNAGRELLDRGVVRAFDSPNNIANRAQGMMDQSMSSIDDILSKVDAGGGEVSRSNLITRLRNKALALQGNEAKAGQRRALESIIAEVEQGPTSRPVAAAEQVKRDFMAKPSYGQIESNQVEANKMAGNAYKGAVEDEVQRSSPELREQFGAEKQTYGLLSPIQEAAETRAAQQNQSPYVGLKDLVAKGVLGVPGAVANRLFGNRLPSTAAVGADKLSSAASAAAKALENLGIPTEAASRLASTQYSGVLTQAAQRGQQSLATTQFLLNQTDPQFRRTYNGTEE